MADGEYYFPADLPPFNENDKCRKCGWQDISVIFHEYFEAGFPCDLLVLGEHLCRVCRCGHGWCQAALEVKPPGRPDLRVIPRETSVP